MYNYNWIVEILVTDVTIALAGRPSSKCVEPVEPVEPQKKQHCETFKNGHYFFIASKLSVL